MIAISQLRHDGSVLRDFCGVTLDTALFNLKHCGWGCGRCGCGWAACGHAPLRLRLRGRTWIEEVERPATNGTKTTARALGFAGDVSSTADDDALALAETRVRLYRIQPKARSKNALMCKVLATVQP